jgi:hypothetical protein
MRVHGPIVTEKEEAARDESHPDLTKRLRGTVRTLEFLTEHNHRYISLSA